jgi:hypothetical protein
MDTEILTHFAKWLEKQINLEIKTIKLP